jgi:hypothetical protein
MSGVGREIFVINVQDKRTVTSFAIQTTHKPPRDFLAADTWIIIDLSRRNVSYKLNLYKIVFQGTAK